MNKPIAVIFPARIGDPISNGPGAFEFVGGPLDGHLVNIEGRWLTITCGIGQYVLGSKSTKNFRESLNWRVEVAENELPHA